MATSRLKPIGHSPEPIFWCGLQLGCWSFVCFCVLGWHTLAMAADNKPNAGGLLIDIPSPNPGKEKNQEIKLLENADDKEQAESDAFEVSKLIINGNTVFSQEQLHALVKSLEGTSMTLQQLETGIEKITDFYRSNG
jgi:hemolysin activation/secretion protein